MALNPKVFPHGMPIPFLNELFVFAIDGVDFEIDNIPCLGEVQAKGTIYLSNIRMVFVAKNPKDNFIAFDIPLLHISNIARVEFLHLCLFYRLLGETVGALNSVVEGRLSPEATCKAELLCRHKALRYVDPNDPTSIFLQQTTPESQLRCRRTCQSQPSSGAELGSAKGLGQTPFAGKLVDVGSLLLLHVITSLYLESP
ncbi:hypothetical protein T459_21146 [Capsicum annuum]|uniref:GRAM domain-containing protein n=1 Tax=Capsicum annuum TaxID=4072 RepID=A0A2G2YVW7_CAPAN|nr:hypothetical protein T459_21146 [Capsicum annuum]